MTFEELVLLIPQYLAGHLSSTEISEFEKELSTNPELLSEVEEMRPVWDGLDLLPEAQPSPELRAKFYQRLNAQERERPTVMPAVWWKVGWLPQLAAALALFLLGLFVEHVHMAEHAQEHSQAGEMAELHSQVQSLRETVALSLMDRQSATSRLQGISWSSRVDHPDEELQSALLTTLNHDPNVNVRLASLDALEKFTGEPAVRKALAEAIPVQDSPLMQIALIDALVHIHDQEAGNELRKLRSGTEVNAAVRQRAQWGLQKLGLKD